MTLSSPVLGYLPQGLCDKANKSAGANVSDVPLTCMFFPGRGRSNRGYDGRENEICDLGTWSLKKTAGWYMRIVLVHDHGPLRGWHL